MLQPIDIVVAFDAAFRRHQSGAWAPATVREDLELPWSSLNLSLRRLARANIVRDGRVNRGGLAALLPALQYLVPLSVDGSRRVRGMPTGISSSVFEHRIVARAPLVWETDLGDAVGVPVAPLHGVVPAASGREPYLHAVFACLDAARGGRARELGLATKKLQELVGLPAPMMAA